jgi:hypothetical protein
VSSLRHFSGRAGPGSLAAKSDQADAGNRGIACVLDWRITHSLRKLQRYLLAHPAHAMDAMDAMLRRTRELFRRHWWTAIFNYRVYRVVQGVHSCALTI